MKREHLQHMADLRITEACHLMNGQSWSAAYYLLGYAVEFALKSCISKQFAVETIPDKSLVNKIFTHDFDTLINLATLRLPLKQKVLSDPKFAASLSIGKEWTPDCRYAIWSEAATVQLHIAITHETYGVLPWIKMHW